MQVAAWRLGKLHIMKLSNCPMCDTLTAMQAQRVTVSNLVVVIIRGLLVLSDLRLFLVGEEALA